MAKILIIDDEKVMRDFITKTLTPLGYSIDSVGDGWTGMQIFRRKRHDLIITDIFMPGIEGLDVIDEISSTYPGVKTIAISGGGKFEMEYTLELAKEIGADTYMAKPFSAQELIFAVNELFSEAAQDNKNGN